MSSVDPPGQASDVVVTGLGVVSPIGVGREAFWSSMLAGKSGVGPITRFDSSGYPVHFAAEVKEFDPKAYIRPRKSLKVMAREIQFGFAAADMALTDAALDPARAEPDRFGVVFGADMIYCDLDEIESAYRACLREGKIDLQNWATAAMPELYPLWLLRNLPNMVACHVAIANDARGPNNTIGHSDVGGLNAIIEAVRVIQRNKADIMIAGGVGCRINPTVMSYRGDKDLSHRNEDPTRASRPFDAHRDGLVNGEGAAAFIFESRQHAQRRGARILARVLGFGSAHEPVLEGPLRGIAIQNALRTAITQSGIDVNDIAHVNAHGLSTVAEDRYEADAIQNVLGDVPVTAPKSFFGHTGGGGGALELAASLIGLVESTNPFTLNYEMPDPGCPLNVIRGEPQPTSRRVAVKLSSSRLGPAAALILAAE
jgi:3-oxoacyl-[acyl-carrier-protein] synthase II